MKKFGFVFLCNMTKRYEYYCRKMDDSDNFYAVEYNFLDDHFRTAILTKEQYENFEKWFQDGGYRIFSELKPFRNVMVMDGIIIEWNEEDEDDNEKSVIGNLFENNITENHFNNEAKALFQRLIRG